MKEHIIIAGTGRCGTSALVQFFEKAGFDVGKNLAYSPNVRAGFEYVLDPNHKELAIRLEEAPYIIKDPRLCHSLAPLLDKGLQVAFALIPVRDLGQASASRLRPSTANLKFTPHSELKGGAPHPAIEDPMQDQLIYNQRALGQLIETLTLRGIPYKTIAFPNFIEDRDLLYNALIDTPLAMDRIRYDRSFEIFRPDMIHKY